MGRGNNGGDRMGRGDSGGDMMGRGSSGGDMMGRGSSGGDSTERERQSGRVNLPRCLPELIPPYTPSPLRSSLCAPGTKIQTAVTLDWFATVIRWNPLLTPL